jgi:two-component system OmpR family sensor kinase
MVRLRRPRPWRAWRLRDRLVVAFVCLMVLGLVSVDGAGVLLLRSYLTQRVDSQLSNIVRRVPVGGFPAERRPPTQVGPTVVTIFYTSTGQQSEPAGSGVALPQLGGFAGLRAQAGRGPFTVDDGSGPWRVEVVAAGSGYAVAAVSLAEVTTTERQLLLIDAVVSVLVMLAIGGATAAVAGLGLRPLRRMANEAAEITGGDLTTRVAEANPDTEVGRLGTALNTMLGRIELGMAERSASEQRLRRFLADAAHELRTPLTSIQGFVELYRDGGARSASELAEAMSAIEAEAGRMRLLVNDLLLLASLDEQRPMRHSPVDLLEIAAQTVRDAHVRTPLRTVRLAPLQDESETFDEPIVLGDEARLRQVATNLVANALQHTADDARVMVRVGSVRGASRTGEIQDEPQAVVGAPIPSSVPVAVFEVQDTGPGIALAEAPRVFERLYRAESSRSRRHGGAGLGLSIVASIVQAHHGRCELWTQPGGGARFRVLLPAHIVLSTDEEASEPETVGLLDSEVALR